MCSGLLVYLKFLDYWLGGKRERESIDSLYDGTILLERTLHDSETFSGLEKSYMETGFHCVFTLTRSM